jgi:serine/threonine-protein kinase
MPNPRTCPTCGLELAPDAPCPRCLMHLGLDGPGLALSDQGPDITVALAPLTPGGSPVLDTIARSVGPVPRVLLRDTDDGEPAGPVVKPHETAGADATVRYRIDGEIARGGMGAVLKGRDPDLGRDVAIKVLKGDLKDRPELVRRFVEEAQIGGQLQHPGIVPIYELGTFADRRPFFSMKLVKGRTLAAILAGRQPGDGPRLLAIFHAIAQTMAYAHTRGVVHRDLKPSNVMVGSFGEVQVMDWGLAKVLPRGGLADEATPEPPVPETMIATVRSGSDHEGDRSQAGSVLGTPGYMAPEQARGEVDRVDERADVFALGSILCEALTGKPAVVGRNAAEVRRDTALGDTADGLRRLESCGADAALLALARDCLAFEPADRPRDARAVAERMGAYLDGVQEQLKLAERDRAVAEAKAVEERKRRRLQVGLAASLLALTALGGVALTYARQQQQARQARVDRRLAEARLLRDQARERPEDVARWRLAHEAVDRIAEDVDPSAAPLAELRQAVEARMTAAEADRDLLARLVDIRSAQADDPDGSDTDAAYADAVADAGIDPDGGDPAGAGAKVARRPAPVAAALVAALDHWAAVRRGRDARGPGWTRVLAIARAADLDPDRDALRAALLVEDDAERLGRLRPLAGRADAGSWAPASLVLLGYALADAGDLDAGVAVLRQASWSHPEDAQAHYALGRLLERARPPRPEEAIRAYSVAWGRQPELAGHELAHALEGRGRGVEAETVWRDLVARRPGNGRYLACYGGHLKDRGRGAEAAAVLGRAVAVHREAVRLRPDDASANNLLGLALRVSGDPVGAVAAHREAIRRRPDDAWAHTNLGAALDASGDLPGAIAACREATRLRPDFAGAHSNLGLALRDSGDLPGAVAALREAIRLKPDLAGAYSNLGDALRVSGDLPGAIAALREATRLRPDLALAHSNLGVALGASGASAGAIAAYREAIRLRPDFAEAHSNLGAALGAAGDLPGAVAAHREAIRLRPDYAEAHCNLAGALRQQGRYAESLAEFRLGHELGSRRADWRYPSAAWVAEAERVAALADRLPGVLGGTDKPADNVERLALAQVAYDTKRYAAAARLWGEALVSDPKLAADRRVRHRYNAACAAALVAAGRGEDEPKPDDAARAELRRRALDWLKSELSAWSAIVANGPPQARSVVVPALRHWKAEADLAAVRDANNLAGLSEDERKDWQALWAEVDALLAKTAAGPP